VYGFVSFYRNEQQSAHKTSKNPSKDGENTRRIHLLVLTLLLGSLSAAACG
jgi:hypothetical protein